MTLDEQLKRIQDRLVRDSGYPYPDNSTTEASLAFAYGLTIGALMFLRREMRDAGRPTPD